MYKRHTISKFESLEEIAEHYQTTVTVLSTLNQVDVRTLTPGDVIMVPESTSTSEPVSDREVQLWVAQALFNADQNIGNARHPQQQQLFVHSRAVLETIRARFEPLN